APESHWPRRRFHNRCLPAPPEADRACHRCLQRSRLALSYRLTHFFSCLSRSWLRSVYFSSTWSELAMVQSPYRQGSIPGMNAPGVRLCVVDVLDSEVRRAIGSYVPNFHYPAIL